MYLTFTVSRRNDGSLTPPMPPSAKVGSTANEPCWSTTVYSWSGDATSTWVSIFQNSMCSAVKVVLSSVAWIDCGTIGASSPPLSADES